MSDLTLLVDAGTDAEGEEIEQLTEQLRLELLELDVDAVRRPSAGEAPPGAKSVGMAAIGALVVEITHSSTMLAAVIGVVQSWLGNRKGRSIKLELEGDSIEVSGISAGDQRELIAAFIARHSTE
jgi:hypothetical protein